jgi:hypothetical protein
LILPLQIFSKPSLRILLKITHVVASTFYNHTTTAAMLHRNLPPTTTTTTFKTPKNSAKQKSNPKRKAPEKLCMGSDHNYKETKSRPKKEEPTFTPRKRVLSETKRCA